MNTQTAVQNHADTIYVRSTISRPLHEDPAARGYFQSSADLARGLEINDSPLGSLSPELIREFLRLRAERRRAV